MFPYDWKSNGYGSSFDGGSIASTTVSMERVSGETFRENPPVLPGFDVTRSARTRDCITLERYSGDTFVISASCPTVNEV